MLTGAQLRDIARLAKLRPLDGKAVGAYIIGRALGVPEQTLLKRVREIAIAETERFRAELSADREKRKAARQPAARTSARYRV